MKNKNAEPILVDIPAIGEIAVDSGMKLLQQCSDGIFEVGKDNVVSIIATGDGKVEFIAFENHTLVYIKSAMGYPAYYPVHPIKMEKPIKAVLMDLDGTSVRSEHFWIWVIQKTTASLIRRRCAFMCRLPRAQPQHAQQIQREVIGSIHC